MGDPAITSHIQALTLMIDQLPQATSFEPLLNILFIVLWPVLKTMFPLLRVISSSSLV